MIDLNFQVQIKFFLSCYLLVTSGYLVVISGCLIVTTGYFLLLLVTSGNFSLLLVPRFSYNGFILRKRQCLYLNTDSHVYAVAKTSRWPTEIFHIFHCYGSSHWEVLSNMIVLKI